MMGGEERIEEVDQQTLIQFSAEDAFEAKVGEEANVAVLEGINHESGTAIGPVSSLAILGENDRLSHFEFFIHQDNRRTIVGHRPTHLHRKRLGNPRAL